MPTAILRVHYWDPFKRANIFKSITSLKKYGGDIEKARIELEQWKTDNIIRMQKLKEEANKKSNNNTDTPHPIDTNTVVPSITTDPTDPTDPTVPATIENQNIIPEPIESKDNDIDVRKIHIPFTKFKLNIAPLKETGSSTVIFGASKSGKTTMMKQIIKDYYSTKDTITIIMADNVHSNIYKDVDSKIIKTDKFRPELISEIHRIQKKTKNKYHWVLILDDLILEKNDPQILRMLLTMRNAKVSTLLLLQSPTLLSKNGRYNANNFIFKKTNNAENVYELMDMFIGGYGVFTPIPRMKDKLDLFREITNDYGSIYLDALNDEVSYHKK